MIRQLSLLSSILLCLWGCSKTPVAEPSGPIARFGTTPTINGEFEAGEWDDATVVVVGESRRFRIKHDSANLYIGLDGGGGNIWFNKDSGLQVLHWSAQLGLARYRWSDSSTQILDQPFEFELWNLQHESPEVVRETLARYLAEHGWTANIAPIGPKMQSEFAISFDWLGVTGGSGRFVAIPGMHIGAGLMLARDDPEAEEIMAMSIEERKKKFPSLFWPEGSGEDHPFNRGSCPDTVRLDPADFGTIWIDLER